MNSPKKILIKDTGENKYVDTITAPGGTEFFIDVSGDPEKHVRICDYVFSAPKDTGLLPGDKVYFHYSLFVPQDERDYSSPNLLIVNGESFWTLDINSVFCYVRDGVLLPFKNNILIIPIHDKRKDKSLLIHNPFAGEIIIKGDNQISRGRVALIGDNTLTPRIEVGDVVFFPSYCEFENVIEGKTYWVMEIEDIYGKEEL